MRKIAVFTGTRAEYGLLHWLMKDIQSSAELKLQLIVSGMHLSPEFGNTWQAIEQDGFQIDEKVEMLLSSDTPVGMAKSMGLGSIGFADALARLQPDILVILGDRFEALAIAQVAVALQIPIAHLHGGEITEGAIDEHFRHAITKLASCHFTATDTYRRRVIQMGEDPDRTFNVGALGLEPLRRTPRLTLAQLRTALNFTLEQPLLVVTYHPVTAGNEAPLESFDALLAALDHFPDHQLVITYPNADAGGRLLIDRLQAYASTQPTRVLAVPSLGLQRYLSIAALADAVIGNSSSGIIEIPSLCKPTVNIGSRQQGRLAADSVIHCEADRASIEQAIQKALSPVFQEHCKTVRNPYDQGNTSGKILEQLRHLALPRTKRFHDLEAIE